MRSLLSSLVDYWSLHEASGNRASATGLHTLTDTNTVTQNPGKQLYAGQFTAASSERLVVASDASLQTGDIDFTLVCWLYLDSLPGASNVYVVAKDDAATQREYGMRVNTSDQLEFFGFRSGPTLDTQAATNFGALSTGTWYFAVGWHDSVNNTKNVEVNLVSDSAATGGAWITSTADLSIGSTGAPGNYFNGRICEVGFWKRMLTVQERWWLYDFGRGRTYPFDGRFSPAMLGRNPALVGPRRTRDVGLLAA